MLELVSKFKKFLVKQKVELKIRYLQSFFYKSVSVWIVPHVAQFSHYHLLLKTASETESFVYCTLDNKND